MKALPNKQANKQTDKRIDKHQWKQNKNKRFQDLKEAKNKNLSNFKSRRAIKYRLLNACVTLQWMYTNGSGELTNLKV